MKKFVAPEMEVVKFAAEDVITASGVEVQGPTACLPDM